mgnify:CR=1 FL=1
MNDTPTPKIISLEEMRHMPLAELSKLDLETLKDLEVKAIAAAEEAHKGNDGKLIFSTRMARSWVDWAIRFHLFERSKDETGN